MQDANIAGTRILKADIAGQATAATPDEFVIGVCPYNLTVTGVTFTAKSTLTGQVTNFLSLTARNRTGAGAGAVNVANLDFSTAPVVATAFAAKAIPLNATAANLQCAAGDVLTCEKLVTGTGLALPAGTITVSYTTR